MSILVASALVLAPVRSTAEPATVLVVVVEPDSRALGYRFITAGTTLSTTKALLDHLAGKGPERHALAVLIDERVPIRALAHLQSVASKLGFAGDEVGWFTVSKDRSGMQQISISGRPPLSAPYSTDPSVLRRLF